MLGKRSGLLLGASQKNRQFLTYISIQAYLLLEFLGGEKPMTGKRILDYFSAIWQF